MRKNFDDVGDIANALFAFTIFMLGILTVAASM
jgi:hypothetical protein